MSVCDRILDEIEQSGRNAAGAVVWLTDDEVKALHGGWVIPGQCSGPKFVVMTDKGEMFGPFDSATAAFDWGVAIYPAMSWSIRPVAEARAPAIPRPAS